MDQKSECQHRHEAAPAQLVQLDRIVDEMRLIKSPQEIELMQIASTISAKAHTRAMQTVRPGMMEYALELSLIISLGKTAVCLLTTVLLVAVPMLVFCTMLKITKLLKTVIWF